MADKTNKLQTRLAVSRPPKGWWDMMEKKVSKEDYTEEQVRKAIGDQWYNKMSDAERKKVKNKYKGSKTKQAAEFKNLFSSKYEKWIALEASLLAANNYGAWSSVEEANQKIDQAVKSLSDTIKKGVDSEVKRIVDEEREDILEEMTESIAINAPNLPQMGPSETVAPVAKKLNATIKKLGDDWAHEDMYMHIPEVAYPKTYAVGTRVKISEGSGMDSGKEGTIVDRSEVKTDGRGIPTNISGAYSPVNWQEEVAIQLDTGELITMFKDRVLKASKKAPMTAALKKAFGKSAQVQRVVDMLRMYREEGVNKVDLGQLLADSGMNLEQANETIEQLGYEIEFEEGGDPRGYIQIMQGKGEVEGCEEYKKEAQRDIPDLEATEITYESYGPGKFSSNLEEWLNEFSMHGLMDEELGEVQHFGWYGLILFDKPIVVHQEGKDWTFQGAIVSEDSNGLVNTDTFGTVNEAEGVWEGLEDEYEIWRKKMMDTWDTVENGE